MWPCNWEEVEEEMRSDSRRESVREMPRPSRCCHRSGAHSCTAAHTYICIPQAPLRVKMCAAVYASPSPLPPQVCAE